MLTQVQLQNYRCFKEATVRLSPLTAIVGPNASGKSSFLRALQPLGSHIDPDDRWQHGTGDCLIKQRFDDGGSAFLQVASGTQRANQRAFHIQALHLDLAALRSPNLVQAAGQIASDGSNLANLFSTLSRDEQSQVSAQFCTLVPVFRDVGVIPTSQPGLHAPRFQDHWSDRIWYTPYQVSDGTMLVLAFILLQYQNPAPDLITIEEPERGLHPYLMGEMVALWRKMTKGEVGPKAVQIVLATHSAELLDHLEPHETRFFTRDEQNDGAIRVEEVPPDDEHWREAFKTYQDSLGSMWLSGGLGGVPRL